MLFVHLTLNGHYLLQDEFLLNPRICRLGCLDLRGVVPLQVSLEVETELEAVVRAPRHDCVVERFQKIQETQNVDVLNECFLDAVLCELDSLECVPLEQPLLLVFDAFIVELMIRPASLHRRLPLNWRICPREA